MDLKPEAIERTAMLEKDRWLSRCHTNEEIHQTHWKLDAVHARQIYACCKSEPEHLEFYFKPMAVVSKIYPAVLGAFAVKCALCSLVANRRSEIMNALKSPNGPMFPMLELKGWVKAVEENTRSCPVGHSDLEIWRLMRMLRVKVVEPKVAKIDTMQYD